MMQVDAAEGRDLSRRHDAFAFHEVSVADQPAATVDVMNSMVAEIWKEKVSDAKELDELVYQETRRLVTAQIQHVTFTEWLPIIIGEDLTRSLGIKHEQCEYRAKAESGIVNSFAAAAFRFGHSLVQSVFR